LPVTNYVDVAAGDQVRVTLSLPAAGDRASSPAAGADQGAAESPPARVPNRRALRTVGWISTGVLAVGAATFGVLALGEAHDLSNARSGLTTSGALSRDANLTATYSVLADTLGAAAILAGGLSLYWTLSSPNPEGSADRRARPHIGLGLGSAHFETTF
jgi:hypothetical protein